jgi:predicted RNase H-like nuclease (RuvC/YqgF family)
LYGPVLEDLHDQNAGDRADVRKWAFDQVEASTAELRGMVATSEALEARSQALKRKIKKQKDKVRRLQKVVKRLSGGYGEDAAAEKGGGFTS